MYWLNKFPFWRQISRWVIVLGCAWVVVATGCGRNTDDNQNDGDLPTDQGPTSPPQDDDDLNPVPRGPQPGAGLVTFDLPKFNNRTSSNWSPVLKDIMNHEAPGDSNNYDDLITLGHETSHGIHSHIRNNLNQTGKRVNGFYLLDGLAVIIEEPAMRKSRVAPLVPQSLRNSRYDLYVAGSPDWDDRPTYLMDEWVAYTNGAAVGVDLAKRGMWRAGWRDGVRGAIDFSVFVTAMALAVERHDPAYFASNVQFREFVAWNLQRAMALFFEGRKFKEFASTDQDAYYATFRDSPEAAELRNFLIRTYGETWVQTAVFTE
ncbi:MAG: hypothetical protein RIQ81_1067 [Pseudomonadota bacterium]|jgi:hypothetical protein